MSGERTFIRTMHPSGYRSGQWAELLTIVPAPDKSDCYVVRFPDGMTDYWVVNDPDGQYEFKFSASASRPVSAGGGSERDA